MEPNPKGKHIDQQLAKEVKREDFHEWTPEQIVFYQKKNPLGVSSRCDPEDPSYKKHERTLLAAAEYERRKEGLEEDIECKKEAVLEEKGKKAEFKFNDITDYDVKSMLCDNVDQLSRGEPRQRSYPRDNDQLPWEERPLHKSRQLESLTKLYKDEDKYRDGTDSFDYKLKIFFNNCNNACVEKKFLKEALTVIFTGDAREKYLDFTLHDDELTFDQRCDLIKSHYETDHWVNRRETVWNTINLTEEIRKCPDRLQAFNNLEKELRHIQRGLQSHAGDAALRTRIINACSGVAELHFVLFSPAKTDEGCLPAERQYQTARGSDRARRNHTFSNRGRDNGAKFKASKTTWDKGCIVCKKPSCWSSEHTPEEQRVAFEKVKKVYPSKDNNAVHQFALKFEGESLIAELHHFLNINEPNEEINANEEYFDEEDTNQYLISEIGGENALSYLQDQTTHHTFIAPRKKFATSEKEKLKIFTIDSIEFNTQPNNTFDFKTATPEEIHFFETVFALGNIKDDRYDERIFHGVLFDTGAAGRSTFGIGQVKALQRIQKDLKVDKARAGEAKISGIGSGVFVSLCAITLDTPVGKIIFHVLPCNTPFLLALEDMTRLGITPDVQKDVMLRDKKPVAALIRKYGHLWMTLGRFESLFIYDTNDKSRICYLTEQQIKTCHRRWGHPSTTRMWKVLRRAGHDTDIKVIDRITKFCQNCQLNANRPLRFKFTLSNKDVPFNHTVYVDVLHLEDGPAVHLVDAGTNLGSAAFLTGPEKQSSTSISNSIDRCWNNVYVGPPENLVHDAGKNFASAEFRKTASTWKTRVVEVPTEAHHSIGKVEHAHKDLRRAYSIFKQQFSGQHIDRHTLLKMAVKALNDTAGPDGLVPTLCASGAYPRITWDDAPSPLARKGKRLCEEQ
ncbi:hypothetical protein K3495_g6420 [Podosphaera aphanis]|nr:hypothetical protein K3495_g6420 [Podosphaera aphanis]